VDTENKGLWHCFGSIRYARVLASWRGRTNQLSRRDSIPGSLPQGDRTTPNDIHANWDFPPAPKLSALSERVVPIEETARRVSSVIGRIPVTRVADLTPMDYLRLPVYSAVTPLALDLTTHLGKGNDDVSARVSALMEAVERVSGEACPPGSTTYASFDALCRTGGAAPANPFHFDLPADSAYSPELSFNWIEGFDLAGQHPVLLPVDLACSPPRERILRHADTNGLASGNTRLEAVVHAVCEVIERDAISQHEFRTLFGDSGDRRPPSVAIDLHSVAGPARYWIERVREHGLEVILHEITADIEVPTFRAFVIDSAFPTPQGAIAAHFPGFGTHPNAQLAVLRAVTEAIQSRLAAIQGARDAYNVLPTSPRNATQMERERELTATDARSLADTRSGIHVDLRDDLRFLLKSLRKAGFEQVIAVDLTRADLGLPVVRVRVPGLATFVVNRRRVGRRVLRYLV
jgi:ribosomal protein S12 methylthiotransferase accessory factor